MTGRFRIARRLLARRFGAVRFRPVLAALLPGLLLVARIGVAAADEAPFRLCADPDNLPFSSTSQTTPGIYIDIGRMIAARLGRPFEPVWAPTYYARRAVRRTLLAKRCDGFIGLPDDPDFMGPRLIFSKPILNMGYALVVPRASSAKSLADLVGKRVVVQFGSGPQNILAARNDMQPVTVLSPEEGMTDLAKGEADAAFIWGPSAGWIDKTQLHEAYRIVPVAGPGLQWTAVIGFAHDNQELRDKVDGVLTSLSAPIHELMAKYGFPETDPVRLAALEKVSQTTAPTQSAANAPAPTPKPADNAAEVAAGHELFNENCSHCHGPDAVQGERRIDLRLLHHRYGDKMNEVFHYTVTHGRITKGMPNWSGILTDDQFHKILAFLHSVQQP